MLPNCRVGRLVAHWQMPGLVDSLAQILAGFEVRHVLASERHRLAGLRIAAHSGRPVVQGEAAKPADFDALAARERFAHELQDVLDRQFNVLGGQVFLAAGDRLDQLGLCHEYGPSSQATGTPSYNGRRLTPESAAP